MKKRSIALLLALAMALLCACGGSDLSGEVQSLQELLQQAANAGQNAASSNGGDIPEPAASSTAPQAGNLLSELFSQGSTASPDAGSSYSAPDVGASMDDIRSALIGEKIETDETEIGITSDNLFSVDIVNAQMDKAALREAVVVDVRIENQIAAFEGQLKVDFKCDESYQSWQPIMVSRTGSSDFAIRYISGMEPPQPSEELAISHLTEGGDGLINAQNISSIALANTIYENMGKRVTYVYEAIMSSDYVDAICEFTIETFYSDGSGWSQPEVAQEVTGYDAAKLVGVWSGTYHYSVFYYCDIELDITSADGGTFQGEGVLDGEGFVFSGEVISDFFDYAGLKIEIIRYKTSNSCYGFSFLKNSTLTIDHHNGTLKSNSTETLITKIS